MITDDLLTAIRSAAEGHFDNARFAPAAELLSAYLTRRRGDAAAWALLGRCLRLLGRYRKSERALRASLRLSSECRHEIAADLGWIYRDAGRRRSAERWFKAATKHAASEDCDWVRRGANLAGMGRFGAALRCHRRAAAMAGDVVDEAYLNIGLVLRAQRKYDGALEALHRALALTPSYPEAATAIASLEGIGDALEIATSVNSGRAAPDAGGLAIAPDMRAETGPLASNEDVVDAGKAASDDHLDWIYSCAREHSEQGREALTAELLSAYVKRRRQHSFAWFLLGDSLRVLGRSKEARRALQIALSLAPEHRADIAPFLGTLFKERGRRRLAEQWLTIATDSRDAQDYHWIARGENLACLGELDAALQCHRQAAMLLGLSEDEAYLNIGLILRAKRDYSGAMQSFRRALEINPLQARAKEGIVSLDGVEQALQFARRVARRQRKDKATSIELGEDGSEHKQNDSDDMMPRAP